MRRIWQMTFVIFTARKECQNNSPLPARFAMALIGAKSIISQMIVERAGIRFPALDSGFDALLGR